MRSLAAIVEQEAKKLRQTSDATEPLSIDDLARLVALAKCAKLLGGGNHEEPDDDDEPTLEELRRRASG